jgi:hypothetical protein
MVRFRSDGGIEPHQDVERSFQPTRRASPASSAASSGDSRLTHSNGVPRRAQRDAARRSAVDLPIPSSVVRSAGNPARAARASSRGSRPWPRSREPAVAPAAAGGRWPSASRAAATGPERAHDRLGIGAQLCEVVDVERRAVPRGGRAQRRAWGGLVDQGTSRRRAVTRGRPDGAR